MSATASGPIALGEDASIPRTSSRRGGKQTPFDRKSLSMQATNNKETSGNFKKLVDAVAPFLLLKGIFPNGGRRHSFSNPETVQSFNREPENRRLEEHIKLPHLHELLEIFENHDPPAIKVEGASKYAPTKYIQREAGSLNLDEFKATIAGVLKSHEYDDQLEKLFTKLDTSCDGYVDWDEFITYMLLQYRENDYMRTKKELPFLVEPKIRHIVHNRQETTTRVVALDNPLRYVTVSKEGSMSIFSKNLHLEKTYCMIQEEEDTRGQKRRFKMWVTDACLMKNCNRLVVGSTCRDLRFYDVSTSNYYEEFHVYGLPHVPMCMDYYFDPKDKHGPSLLMYGDDGGSIHVVTFVNPIAQLFTTSFKSQEGVQKIFHQDIGNHSRWAKFSTLENIHNDSVCKIMYMSDNDCIISSSTSSRSSLVIGDTQRKHKGYVFNIQKGVETFDYNKNLNVLVTGSADHTVRLWNPYVTNKPIAVLQGHVTSIVGVMIHEELQQVFSYSKDAVVKVWDVKEHMCLQTVIIKFPSSLHGRLADHGPFPTLLLPDPHNLAVFTCSDYIGVINTGKSKQLKSTMPTTHQTGLCCALYNPYFKQVVTGSDDSSICLWDAETGNKAILFTHAHGDEEITCMAFDGNWRRLVTGARNGTIKVWNFQNGHNLHKLQSIDNAEVTGIIPFTDKKFILAVGWNQKITTYDDSQPDNHYIEAETNWKGGQVHKDDILAVAHSSPNLLATASYDGEIIVWSLETEKIFLRLRKAQEPPRRRMSEQEKRASSGSRPNSRHKHDHRPQQGRHPPVDKLLFLQARADAKLMESAILISSEAGVLRWWSVFGHKHELGFFYASDIHDESVLALNTDPSNYFLITGDTQGHIFVWNISQYCLKAEPHRVRERPPVMYSWRAHDSTVVSVEYIDHRFGRFIISASTDHTSRMWTVDGQFIGTFGQQVPWNLMVPETWAHPLTPWSTEEDIRKLSESDQNPEKDQDISEKGDDDENGQNKSNNESTSDSDRTSSISPQNSKVHYEESVVRNRRNDSVSNNNNNNDMINEDTIDIPALEKGDTLIADDDEVFSSASQQKGILYSKSQVRKTKSVTMDTRRNRMSSPEFIQSFHNRANTFHFDSNLGDPKSIIGIKAEREFVRKKLDRQERRGHFGEIDCQKTSMFGKLCSPFHALYTPAIEDVSLPDNLPITPRMLDRGYTALSSGKQLENMDLSYYKDDLNSKTSAKNDVKKKYVPKLPAIKSRASSRVSSNTSSAIKRNIHTSP